jgi:hypothetical protein
MSIGGGYPGFLARLKGRMETLGLNESSLARRLGTKQPNIQRWFRGSWPGGEWMQKLPGALECSLHWLVTEQGDPLPPKASTGEVYQLAKKVAAEELRIRLREATEGVLGPTDESPGQPVPDEGAAPTLGRIVAPSFPDKLPAPSQQPGRKKRRKGKG